MSFYIGNKIIEVDSTGKFLGHQFLLKDTLHGSKKCKFCGKWFDWVNEEPQHCGNSACEYFYRLRIEHLQKQDAELLQDREFARTIMKRVDMLSKMGVAV